MPKNRNTGLGRGLDAIFVDNTMEESSSISHLRLSEIEPRLDQPRKNFDAEALAALADSISVNGVLQPLVVREQKNGYYQIIAGERRWRAAKMAGLSEVPVMIVDADDRRASELALIENIQREDLNAIEEAAALQSLMEDYNLTQEEISKQVGRSRSAVTNTLRLLDLPDTLKRLVVDGTLSAGHARALLGLRRREDMVKAAHAVETRGLSVRATEELVKTLNRAAQRAEEQQKDQENGGAIPAVDYAAQLSKRVSESLGRSVRIRDDQKKKTLEITYRGNEDLEAILRLLCGDDFFENQ